MLRELCLQAGDHELGEENRRMASGGGSSEEQEVRMMKFWGNGHLMGEDVKVVPRDDDTVKAFCCDLEALK